MFSDIFIYDINSHKIVFKYFQLSLQEWDIPWDELNMCDKLGEGHFGTVYSGNWHGPVAIKVINMDYLDYEKTLEAFKAEVSNLIKYKIVYEWKT